MIAVHFDDTVWSAIASVAAVFLLGLAASSRIRPGRRLAGRPIHRRKRRAALTDDDLVAFLDNAARSVRSGAAASAAITAAAAEDPRLQAMLAGPATASPSPGQQVTLHAVQIALEMGGRVAETLNAAAAVLRQRQAIRAEASAHSAQARLSARVLTLVPLGFAVFIASSRSGRAILVSPVGVACLLIGATLNGLGALWMRRLIRDAGQ
ncbi:MAG TPA: type II secretion system F family protein [Ilumatobacteraceae bacterium]|nr:type II secretion system F family protein [Ilumatobacteraceae bacterium]